MNPEQVSSFIYFKIHFQFMEPEDSGKIEHRRAEEAAQKRISEEESRQRGRSHLIRKIAGGAAAAGILLLFALQSPHLGKNGVQQAEQRRAAIIERIKGIKPSAEWPFFFKVVGDTVEVMRAGPSYSWNEPTAQTGDTLAKALTNYLGEPVDFIKVDIAYVPLDSIIYRGRKIPNKKQAYIMKFVLRNPEFGSWRK